MAARLEFYLSDDDVDRLFAIKEDLGKNNLNANEFAKELLEAEIHKLHPRRVRYDDETGIRIKD